MEMLVQGFALFLLILLIYFGWAGVLTMVLCMIVGFRPWWLIFICTLLFLPFLYTWLPGYKRRKKEHEKRILSEAFEKIIHKRKFQENSKDFVNIFAEYIKLTLQLRQGERLRLRGELWSLEKRLDQEMLLYLTRDAHPGNPTRRWLNRHRSKKLREAFKQAVLDYVTRHARTEEDVEGFIRKFKYACLKPSSLSWAQTYTENSNRNTKR